MKAAEIAAAVEEYRHNGLDAELTADSSLEGMARIKLAFDQIREHVKKAEDALVLIMQPVIPKDGVLIEGIGMVTGSHKPQKPKTDSEAVLARLYAQAMDERQVDRETGAFEPSASALLRVIKECSPITTPSHKWRRAKLKKRLPNLDEFERVEGWTTTVRIQPIGTPDMDEDEDSAA